MIIGYTTGVYDLFHIGHVNLLKNARSMCDKLIVGVTVDELAGYKEKQPIIPFSERIEIVRSCRYVDLAVPQYDMDKLEACRKMKVNIVFVGDDWYDTATWKKYEEDLTTEGIQVIYLPYTRGICSTRIVEQIAARN